MSTTRLKQGYTLTEVLIALAIVALIATFTIPKVITSTGTTHQFSTCKEIFNVLYTLLDQGMVTGDLETDGSNFGTFFMGKIKAVKKCRSNARLQGCWLDSQIDYAADVEQPGMILSNGAFLVGFNNTTTGQNSLLLDWNGTQGPNIVGSDQLFLALCYDSDACTVLATQDPGTIAPVTDVTAYDGDMAGLDAENQTLFNGVSNLQ